ncbi:hypothetical protein RJT34_09868 [Clitoria ternatea]|uniref:Late embryogenesis abundant protein LEA-2 subgroup domain-containing protein n=1 Tax=Clitoria ternatea TaxID=43366 RepID=A0AAN9PVC6_CLITE
MEERVPLSRPPPPPPFYEDDMKPKFPNMDAGTYVVQVPKDQVYRVPPPENAKFMELQRKSSPKKEKKGACCCCYVLILIIIIIVIIGAILCGLFSVVFKPKDPRFSIRSFSVIEKKPHPKYKITLQVNNPNSKVSISYKQGGDVSLSLQRRKIASGPYPAFHQDPRNSTLFGVTLKGSEGAFPKEVEKSDKKKVYVAFSLAIHLTARMKLWLLHSGTMKFDLACQLKLDSLTKTTRVLSQHCKTTRR